MPSLHYTPFLATTYSCQLQAREAPGYFDKIREPKDLGTIFNNLKEGIYSTAHQVSVSDVAVSVS